MMNDIEKWCGAAPAASARSVGVKIMRAVTAARRSPTSAFHRLWHIPLGFRQVGR